MPRGEHEFLVIDADGDGEVNLDTKNAPTGCFKSSGCHACMPLLQLKERVSAFNHFVLHTTEVHHGGTPVANLSILLVTRMSGSWRRISNKVT